jgi:hypothetical protein
MRVAREAGQIREILSWRRQSGNGELAGIFEGKADIGVATVEVRLSNFNGVSRVKGSERRWRQFPVAISSRCRMVGSSPSLPRWAFAHASVLGLRRPRPHQEPLRNLAGLPVS